MIELEIINALQNKLPDFFKIGTCNNLKKFRLSKKYYDKESDNTFISLIDDISTYLHNYILQNSLNSITNKYFINCIDFKKELLYESSYIDTCYYLFQKNVIVNPKFGMFFSENPKFFFENISLMSNNNFISKIGKYLDKNIFVNYLNTTESTMLSFDNLIYDFSVDMLKITDDVDNIKQIDIEYSISYEFINRKIICVLTDKFTTEYKEYISFNRDEKINNILNERDC